MEMHHHDVGIWGSWQLAPEIVLPLLLLTYLYARQPKGAITTKQKSFFYSGILSALSVIVTPIGARAMDFFSLHMVQHITLMMITGPLLVLGTPSSFHPTNRFFEGVTHPAVSWLTYAALMIGVHLPVPHKFIMDNPWAHTFLEVPLYLLLPYFFYFNLLDRNLVNRRISPAMAVISLFIMMVPETLTGFFIYTAPGSLYDDMYSLNDQRQGGSLMWAGAMVIDAVWISFAVHHWIKSEEKKSRDIDAEIAGENA
jgi:cytochrome c oxidase assembly factor CtaG